MISRTDQTEEIARALAARFPDAVRYFRHENRLGPGGNYQFLIGQARGEYIAHLDGDDFWMPGKLAKQISVMDKDSGISASYTNALCINDDGVSIGIFNNPQPSEFGINYLFSRGNFLNHSSMLYRSSAKQDLIDWPSDFVDYKIHIMLAARGKIGLSELFGGGVSRKFDYLYDCASWGKGSRIVLAGNQRSFDGRSAIKLQTFCVSGFSEASLL